MASSVQGARTLVVSEVPAGNSYLYGADLTVVAPITGDLNAVGGTVTISTPVSGDVFLSGASLSVRKPVAGDLRALGASIHIDDTVAGDVVALGGTVTVNASPAFAWVGGGKISFTNGAKGPVTVYGSTISLGGTYDGDVHAVASDRISLAEGTIIHGSLRYDAPQQAEIPDSVVIDGGVIYTGKSFLPTTEEAQTFAIAGASIFFFVRILAAVIAAGLMAGLFPRLAQSVADRALAYSVKRFILLALLGFAVLVATPVFILLLLASFAGAAVAVVLGAAYLLLIVLSYLYAAVIAGGALARGLRKRQLFYWRDAVFGMLALSIITLVPVLGVVIMVLLMAAACGSLISLVYQTAYPKDIDMLEIE